MAHTGVEHRTQFAPDRWDREDEHRRKLAQAANAALKGLTNNHFTLELDLNATTTEVTVETARPGTIGLVVPLSAAAAATVTEYWTEADIGKVTIHHGASATERRVGLVVIG